MTVKPGCVCCQLSAVTLWLCCSLASWIVGFQKLNVWAEARPRPERREILFVPLWFHLRLSQWDPETPKHKESHCVGGVKAPLGMRKNRFFFSPMNEWTVHPSRQESLQPNLKAAVSTEEEEELFSFSVHRFLLSTAAAAVAAEPLSCEEAKLCTTATTIRTGRVGRSWWLDWMCGRVCMSGSPLPCRSTSEEEEEEEERSALEEHHTVRRL